jgi:cytochrome c oxidase cbb3-type subunit I/II
MNVPIIDNATSRFQQFGDRIIDHYQGDRATKWWFFSGLAWFPIFTVFGFFLATKFVFPNFLDESLLTFGRMRPFHFDSLIYGFLSSFLLGAMFYIVPRVCATPLRFPWLSKIVAVLWNAAVIGGGIWILLGGSQGKEYAEYPWVIDIILIVLVIVMAFIIYSTVISRNERKLYISAWFYMATLTWFPIFYAIGNVIWQPPQGALNGVMDAMMNWYFGHNFFGLWITTLGLPAWYYIVPVVLKRPLYSFTLGLISFFGTAFFYSGVGSHHLLQAPIPDFVKTTAVTMSFLMAIPVLAFSANMFMTMRGSWGRVWHNPILAAAMVGVINYVAISLEGVFQSARNVNAFIHFSQWVVGHSHLAFLGSFAFLAVALGFWLIPKITGRLVNYRLMSITFWMMLFGFAFFFLSMLILGIQQNSNWWSHINVIETLPTLRIMLFARAISGGIVVVSAFIFFGTIISSLFKPVVPALEAGERGIDWPTPLPVEGIDTSPIPVIASSRPETPRDRRLTRITSGLNIPAVAGGGLALFALMTLMVVLLPYIFNSYSPTQNAHQLTQLEFQGEQIYKANGCVYCHSQETRVYDWAQGDVSNSGDYYYSVPNFIGTERTGPNLMRIGGKRPTQWLIVHFEDPRSVSPRSLMPLFKFLSEDDLNALTSYVQNLGGPAETGGKDLASNNFFPVVPQEYQDKTNPNLSLQTQVSAGYNPQDMVYSGPLQAGIQWGQIFENGKLLFSQKCLTCHGCSGNGEGTYAREALTVPANLHERISRYPPPPDTFHFWRISEGVPGTKMPPWGWSLDENTRWLIATYEESFVNGAIRTVSHQTSLQESAGFAANNSNPLVSGTKQDYTMGGQYYNLYCAQCHGGDGSGKGEASGANPGGYIKPYPYSLIAASLEITQYGQYVWFVENGLETTNMPPWKEVLTNQEMGQIIFYIQGFSSPEVYSSKWAPLYSDSFAKGLKK